MSWPVLRAWLVAHDAVAVGMSLVATAVVLRLGSAWLLPVPGTPRAVPFWQLTPALLAMLASATTVNRLPVGTGARHRGVRLVWALSVLGFAAACAALVGSGSTLPSLVPGTAVAVALTFATGALVGRASVWVGATLGLVVLDRTTRVAAADDLWHALTPGVQAVLLVVASAGLVGYARAGVRYP